MKKLIAMMIAVILPLAISAQKIKTDKYDKFAKSRVIQTKTERLHKNPFPKHNLVDMSVRLTGDNWSFPTLLTFDSKEKLIEGNGITLLLDNGDTVKFNTEYTGITEKSSIVYKFNTVLMLDDSVDIEKLKNHSVTDIRVSTMSSHYDIEVGEKKEDLLKDMINLVVSRSETPLK